MEHEEYMKGLHEKWMDEHAAQSMLLGPNMRGMAPDLGYFIEVEGLKVYESIFKDEYDAICAAHGSIMNKLKRHYEDSIKKKV